VTTATKKPKAARTGERAQRADARRNRTAVLDAARKLFFEDGMDAGMDQIAREAGVGVGTVYRHFPHKRDLVIALVHEHFARLAEAAADALEEDDAWKAFREFMRWSVETASKERAIGEFLGGSPELGEVEVEQTGLAERTEKLIRKAQRQGKMRKDVVVEDVPTLVCSIASVASTHNGSIASQNWSRLVEITLDGMRACPGTSKLPAPNRRIGDR
jgi:AcrR family transcriptional regulator